MASSKRGSFLLLLSCTFLSSCGGNQSALDPAGSQAEQIAVLFWWMTAVGGAIWLGCVVLTVWAVRIRPEKHPRKLGLLVIWGGAALPTAVLTVLLVFGLSLLSDLVAAAPAGALRITVVGEQWWWRVRYDRPDGEPIVLANEIRLPVGKPVLFTLESPDVIHSFWIPSLGGKIDMTPGRTTELTLTPTRKGVFRGVCAEFCGSAHALMRFDVVVEDEDAFNTWLENQERPAHDPITAASRRGRELFFANGCGACHTIKGTEADGVVGPDLTHIGSRLSIGAGIMPSSRESLARWIEKPDAIKPGVHMPAFGMLSEADRDALAAYLKELA